METTETPRVIAGAVADLREVPLARLVELRTRRQDAPASEPSFQSSI